MQAGTEDIVKKILNNPKSDYYRITGSMARIENYEEIFVSSKIYRDCNYEYKNIKIPYKLYKVLPNRLLENKELRQIGLRIEKGWDHFSKHLPEPNILMFRRKL